jgi:hypothetical protein
MMNWMRKNSFFSMMIIFTLLFSAVLFLKDENIEQYEQITISHGESLWSLADQYRGKMSKHDWITQVEKANQVNRHEVLAGAVLSIPVEEQSAYIAQKEADKDVVKVASE